MAGCNTQTCTERVARKQCSNANPRACIRRAILTYRLDTWQAAWMWRVAWCESRYLAHAANASGAYGLYQHLPSTWLTTRYARRDRTRAKWQALAAAEMLRAGRSREWVCR